MTPMIPWLRLTVALVSALLLALPALAIAQSAAPPARPSAGGRAAPADASPPGTTPMTGATSPIRSDYVIGPGDVLQITVWKNDTLSRTAPVRPDGKISMPLLHDVVASGLTAMQLRDKIATAL